MVDPFLFFGLTSKISFTARITVVCSMSSSSNSSKLESSEEDEFSTNIVCTDLSASATMARN
jgi:hypothetical protein